MYRILFLTLFLVIDVFSSCHTISGQTFFSDQIAYNDFCSHSCEEPAFYSGVYYYNSEKIWGYGSGNGNCPYSGNDPNGAYFCDGGWKRCVNGCNYKNYCTTEAEACEASGQFWNGYNCEPPPDTLCINIPLSISAQIGTPARAYYIKQADGTLKKILNDGNAETLCRKSIDQGTGDITIINDLAGPNGENYGTFCRGSCESVGQSNGGQVTCSGFGCHETADQTGAINPNDYGGGSGNFGPGTGGGFGSGGGSGGSGGGLIGDSLAPDTSETSNSWASGCNVLNFQTCTCDGFTYVGSSGNTATVYNHTTGQTGTCGLDLMPEVASCPVDWTTCTFKKTPNDTTNYSVDSVRTDSLGDWEYNYFPILNEINASIKALDYNQNSNAKDMQNFFNNYQGSSFGGGGSGGSWDTTILEFPDTNIDVSNWLDSINNWREQASGLIDAMGVFSLDSFVSDTNLNYDTNAVVTEILDVAKSITDSAAYLFNIDFSDLGGSSNCPAFLSQTRYIELYTGTQIPIDYSYLCTIEIFGKPLFELIRVVLRLLVSLSCAFAIFKATVGFRE